MKPMADSEDQEVMKEEETMKEEEATTAEKEILRQEKEDNPNITNAPENGAFVFKSILIK